MLLSDGVRRVRHHAALLAVTLWVVAGINLATPGPLARSGHLKGEDYAHFYVLGRLADEGRVADLYDAEVQARHFAAVVPGAPLIYFGQPAYGPQVGLLFAPFARLPYLSSLALWVAVSLALYVTACYAIWRTLGPLKAYRVETALLAIGSPALWQLLLHGQNSALALAALSVGWLALRSGRRTVAGLVLGILFYKPQLGMAAAAVLLLTGQWTVLCGMAVSAAAQLGLVHLALGPDALVEYAKMLVRLPGTLHTLEPKLHLMYSFRAFFTLLPLAAPLPVLLASTCSIAAIAVVVRHWKTAVDPDVSFALLLIATVLVSPHTTVYDLVLLAPVLSILADRELAATAATGTVDRTRWALLLVVFLLPLLPNLARTIAVQPLVICLAWLVFDYGRGPVRPVLRPIEAHSS